MKVYVKSRDYGFFTSKPITVQVRRGGELVHCNHDGYQEDDHDFDIIRSDDTIRTVTNKYDVCDKCYAYRLTGDEEWQDEPR